MKFQRFLRKRVWIPSLILAFMGIGVWAWLSRGPKYTDVDQLPYTVAEPSPESLHAAPCYGTKVRFEDSVAAAYARARRDKKLVLLLHLSGRFGSSDTT